MASTYRSLFCPSFDCSKPTKRQLRKRVFSDRILAARNDAHDRNYYSGRLVDESMIVLRKRIGDMKMAERNYEPPPHWTEWEKRHFTNYDSFVCEVVGVLQRQLMNTRPCLALGMLALISLSVSVSTSFVAFNLIEMSNNILSGTQLH